MLTTEQILDTTEDVLRRFGPRKTTVVDVARALGVSHGTVYRHFSTKAALHEAITARWLGRVMLPLTEISKKKTKPQKRLIEWFQALMDIKVQNSKDDPEMFTSYALLAQDTPQHVVTEHLDVMIKQVENILLDGKNDGSFQITDCADTARQFFFASYRYHHPVHVHEWADKNLQQDFNQLFALLLKAIKK